MHLPTIQSLRGWRYDPRQVDIAQVVMPASDTISPEGAAALYRRHPRNFVRLAVGRDYGANASAGDRFQRIAAALDAWREEGLFIQDQPAIYLCEQTRGDKGLLVCICLLPLPPGDLVPFPALTMPPTAPRPNHLALMRATGGNMEPIFCFVPDAAGKLQKILAEVARNEPTLAIAVGETSIRLWVSEQPEALQAIRPLVGAQGLHLAESRHRCEDAMAYRNEVRAALRRAGRPLPPLGEMSCDWFLAALLTTADPSAAAAAPETLISLRPYSGLVVNFFW